VTAVALAAAALLLTPTLTNAAQCPAASEAQVRSEFASWMKAYKGRDLSGTMAIFDPGVRFAFQGVADQDWTALQAGYAAEFKARAKSVWTPKWDDVLVSGDLATAFATWTETVAGKRGRTVRGVNRAVDILRRGADCRWRIVRSLNYPVAR